MQRIAFKCLFAPLVKKVWTGWVGEIISFWLVDLYHFAGIKILASPPKRGINCALAAWNEQAMLNLLGLDRVMCRWWVKYVWNCLSGTEQKKSTMVAGCSADQLVVLLHILIKSDWLEKEFTGEHFNEKFREVALCIGRGAFLIWV